MPRIFRLWEVLLLVGILITVFVLLIPRHETRGDVAYRAYAYESARESYARALESHRVSDIFTSLPARLAGPVADFLKGQYYTPQRKRLLERQVELSGYLGDRVGYLDHVRALVAFDPEDARAREQLTEALLWNERLAEAAGVLEEDRKRRGFSEDLALKLADLYTALDDPAGSIPLLEELVERTGKREYRKRLAGVYHSMVYRLSTSGEKAKASKKGGGGCAG